MLLNVDHHSKYLKVFHIALRANFARVSELFPNSAKKKKILVERNEPMILLGLLNFVRTKQMSRMQVFEFSKYFLHLSLKQKINF